MAANGSKGGGEMVLGSRHVIGLFLLIVVISGVVFTLGYVLGRSQYDAQVRAAIGVNKTSPSARPAETPETGSAPPSTAAPPASDWDFFRPSESQKTDGPAAKSAATASKVASAAPAAKPAAAKGGALLNAPLVPRGAILLQVAALTRETDALALAEVLQKKKFPAFVLTPGADHYFRVQVGPYADLQSAQIARRGLENEGFKAILKR